MSADHLDSRQHRETFACQRCRQALSRLRPQQFSNKGLARNPEQHRAPEVRKTAQRPKQLQIMLEGFPKPDPRVQYKLLRADSAIFQSLNPFQKKLFLLADY